MSITINSFPKDGNFWQLNWFGGLSLNPKIETEPTIDVVLELVNTNLSEENRDQNYREKAKKHFRVVAIGIGTLPYLSIGGIWKNQKLSQIPKYQLKKFKDLEYSKEGMILFKVGEKIEDHRYIIPPYILDVNGGDRIHTWCLGIRYGGDPYHLIVPAIELLRFYYCSSTLTAKKLISDHLKVAMAKLMKLGTSGIDKDDICEVDMQPGLTDGDVRLCAALLTSRYAREATRLIYRSIRTNKTNDGIATPRVIPPFPGTGELNVRGKEFQSGGKTRFLVLRITSGNFPLSCRGIRIKNTYVDEREGVPEEQKLAIKTKSNTPRKGADEIDLVQDEEPGIIGQRERVIQDENRFTNSVEISTHSAPIERVVSVTTMIPEKAETKRGSTGDGAWQESSSFGVSFGDNTDARDPQPVRNPPLPATFNNFISILQQLEAKHSVSYLIIQASIEYVDHESGVRSLFRTYENGKKVSWAYLEKDTGTRRQALVARLEYKGKTFYLLEFQRSSTKKESFSMPMIYDKNLQRFKNEEKFLEELLNAYAIRTGRPLLKDSFPELIEKRFPHRRKSKVGYALAISRKIIETISDPIEDTIRP